MGHKVYCRQTTCHSILHLDAQVPTSIADGIKNKDLQQHSVLLYVS